jgi:hypothetical protein
MRKKLKVFLPSWTLWFLVPMMGLLWAMLTYSAFATQSGRDELGWFGWLCLTLVLSMVGAMLWLMGSGRLPAYIIEIDDTEDEIDH